MEKETNYGIAVAVAIIVVILFFSGWYLFLGQSLSQPVVLAPITPSTN